MFKSITRKKRDTLQDGKNPGLDKVMSLTSKWFAISLLFSRNERKAEIKSRHVEQANREQILRFMNKTGVMNSTNALMAPKDRNTICTKIM